jgi:hypothetical protein
MHRAVALIVGMMCGATISCGGGSVPPVDLGVSRDGGLFVTFLAAFDGEATINDCPLELVRFPASCNLWDSCGEGSASAIIATDALDLTVPMVLHATNGTTEARFTFPPLSDAALVGADTLQAAAVNSITIAGGFSAACERPSTCAVDIAGLDSLNMTPTTPEELIVALPAMPPLSTASSHVLVRAIGDRDCEPCDVVDNASLSKALVGETRF